ncbi:hypothetical protein FOXB_17047, partial [Fusarium oxysporum f. sp. conglutinans Fo5176]
MAALDKTTSVELEKQQAYCTHVDAPRPSDVEYDDSYGFSPQEQRRIIRCIDRRLVVTVGAMYCASLVDRTNMSAANIAGMRAELALTGFRY